MATAIGVAAQANTPTVIGKVGENEFRRVYFPIANWKALYPDATFQLVHRRPTDGGGYPVTNIVTDANYLYWTVESGDCAYAGIGAAELIITSGDSIAKSVTYPTQILPSVVETETPPTPWEDYIARFMSAAETIAASEFNVGVFLSQNKILFAINTTAQEIYINGNPQLFFAASRYSLTNGSYSYGNTSTTQIFFVYDRSDSAWKFVNYTAYQPSMIIALAIWNNTERLLNSRYAVYPPCTYAVDSTLCPQDYVTTYDYQVDTSGLTKITYDSSFAHTNPVDVYSGSNGLYAVNVNTDSYKISGASTCYVATTGSDSSGTLGLTMLNPFKTLAHAADAGFTNIYMLPGVYYFPQQVISNSINLIGIGDVTIICGSNGKVASSGASVHFDAPCYVENITFVGGSGVVVQYSSTTPSCFKHCKFLRSVSNGISTRIVNLLMFECEANDNGIDGLNYHQYSSGSTTMAPTGIVEINCKAARNGNSGDRSGNASTIHDHGCIIRVNGEYSLSHGGIMTDSEAMSYNFACRAFGSLEYNNTDPEWTNTAFLAGTNTTMWLYNCLGGGADYMIGARDGSTIYIDRAIRANRQYTDSSSQIVVMS